MSGYAALLVIPSADATPNRLREALADVTHPGPAPEKEVAVPEPMPIVNPNERALLETLSFAEGTWNHAEQAIDYSVCFTQKPGGGTLNTSAPHPDVVRRSRSGYRSAACGAYQFMPRTWKAMHGWHNLPMTPANQDAAALKLVRSVGYKVTKPFSTQAHRLASQWASFPTRGGWSYYGQPVKTLHSLTAFYQQRVEYHERQNVIAMQHNLQITPDRMIA